MHKLFLLFLLVAGFFHGKSQTAKEVKFDHLTTSDGLSNNNINSVLKDDEGFIWIGTLSGLNKYNGYEIETFYHENGNSASLLNNAILWMRKGPDNTIWINTGEGISIYDMIKERFDPPTKYTEILQTEAAFILDLVTDKNGDTWFSIRGRGLVKLVKDTHEQIQANTLNDDGIIKIVSNDVRDINMDKEGNIWILHGNGMIEVIDCNTNKVIRKYGNSDITLDGNNAFELFVDNDKDVWIYTKDSENHIGLYYFNTTTGKSKYFGEKQLSSKIIRAVIQDEHGRIWVGADHGGISVIDKESWKINSIKNDPDDPRSLISNNITNIYKDDKGIIWVGTVKSGLSYYHQSSNNFHHYKYDSKMPSYNDMSSVVEDEKGNLWIGTNGQGLLYFDTKTKSFNENKGYNQSVFTSDAIVSLLYSSNKELWVGTYLEGLKKYTDGILTEYFVTSDNEGSISSNNIWELYEAKDGTIYIGTLNNGIDIYNKKTDTFTNLNSNDGLIANYITAITEDKGGNIWLGTGSGVSVFNPVDKTFTNYSTSDTTDNPLSNNSVTSILCDSNETIWVGTMGGLNIYDPSHDEFIVYKETDGLSSDIVMALLEDNQNHIWMSTSKGITKLSQDKDGFHFQVFDASDGLQGDNFSDGAAVKTSDGRLVFMGLNGFNIFDPNEITMNIQKPDLAFTDFYVSNTRIKPGMELNGRVLLNKNLNYIDKVELNHNENSFAVEFVALSYFQTKKNKYQYKLEGFDEKWVNVSSDIRMANYTNLDYGNYQFRIRASNNHNVWNEEGIGFDIAISPPFWKTPLARAFYVVLILLVLYFTRKVIISRERSKARTASERLEAQRQHELDLMKIKFFTNISHEFRTPLSLVLTPIDSMVKDPENIRVGDFKIIQRNAKRLLTLVNQLLDFRKMEANQHVLSQSNGDLIKFLHDIIESFSDMSREKHIQLIFESEEKEYYTLFDKDKMEKIMFNLLSNAFKFTLPDGKIIVDLEKKAIDKETDRIIISVSDTGIGMPEDKLPYIFNRFFQNDVSGNNMMNNGTGIGLSITKEFVELHKGTIKVESKQGIGTSFIVELPLKDLSKEPGHYIEEMNGFSPEGNGTIATGDKHDYTVSLVEDNADFRFYLKDNLKQYFNIMESSNGKDAWKSILDMHPDIVISDIMMPGMNGLELCKKIKTDPRTAHIPVVLLTAQSSDQHKIEGLEAGAIEYISKPFNFEILVSTINSALRFQKRVNESKKIEIKTSDVSIVSLDEQLVTKAIKLVEDNISNSDFSVEDMSHELGYSRGHFYQKMIKITGQTPMDFIRNIRMKRAAELLKKSQLTVSEIAYKVGYNNPKLFSRYFKSQYKIYPSEFMSRSKEVDKIS